MAESNVIEIAKRLISYPTITPNECGIYEYISEVLKDFNILRLDKNEVKNLFLYRVVGENASSLMQKIELGEYQGELLHFCFAGHIDVVPAGEGWESDPFMPEIRGEYLLGRGSQDMKGGVAAFLDALSQISKSQEHSKPILFSVLLTSDEEGVGIDGTRYALECLESKNLIPNYAIVAEPTCVDKFGDMIKIGRRGSINGVLKIYGKQGHVAYPEKCINPVELLGKRLGDLAGYDLDLGDENFMPSKLVITDIRGGMEVVNVTPNDLKIMFNVRNSTLTTKESLEKYIKNILEGLEYDLEIKVSSDPFISQRDGVLVSILQESVKKVAKNEPVLSTSGGTSDARFFAKYGCEVAEFGVCNDRIHSINERVRISDLKLLSAVFCDVIESIKGA